MKLSVKQRILTGKVNASGFIFDSSIITEKVIRQRILTYWCSDASLFSLPFGYLLLLPHHCPVTADRSPGTPLIKKGTIFFSFSTPAGEKMPSLPDSTVCILRNNRVHLILTDTLAQIPGTEYPVFKGTPADPARWFYPAGIPYIKTVFPELQNRIDAPRKLQTEVEQDLRKQFGQKPADAQMLQAVETIIRKTKKEQHAPGLASYTAQRAKESGQYRPGAISRGIVKAASYTANLLFGLLSALSSFSTSTSTSSASSSNRGRMDHPTQTGRTGQNQRGPGLFDKLQGLFNRLIISSFLGNFLGSRQGKFFNDMIKEFEQGNILEALHKAIPLNKEMAGSLSKINLGLPGRRSSLDINTRPGGRGSSFLASGDFFSYLKELYRKSFNKLAEEGNIKEAAFVLAELLQEYEEAVSFLEKHGMLEKAAELAEARNLPAPLCVRQWLIAGNKERAINLAVLKDCFSEIIVKLEKSGKENDRLLASDLRVCWAREKARGGFYTLAALILKDKPEEGRQMLEYLKAALDDEGIEKVKAVSAIIKYFPGERYIYGLALELIESGGEYRNLLLDEMADTSAYKKNRKAILVVRHGVRLCLEQSGSSGFPREFTRILNEIGELALLEDFSRCTKAAGTAKKETPAEVDPGDIIITYTDRGSVPLHEAVRLRAGRILLALGEAGAVLLNKEGVIKQHYDEPAYSIILSNSGNKALLAAQRGDNYRISRLDLNKKSCFYWTDARISAMADHYDGTLWAAAGEKELILIDVRSDHFGYLWHSGDLKGEITRIGHSEKNLTCIIKQLKSDYEAEIEYFKYTLPSLFLDSRPWAKIPPEAADGIILLNDGKIGMAWQAAVQENQKSPGVMIKTAGLQARSIDRHSLSDEGSIYIPLKLPGGVLIRKIASASHFVLSLKTERGIWNIIADLSGSIEKRIILEGAKQVYSKITGQTLIITDDCGRLLEYNFETRKLDRNHRI